MTCLAPRSPFGSPLFSPGFALLDPTIKFRHSLVGWKREVRADFCPLPSGEQPPHLVADLRPLGIGKITHFLKKVAHIWATFTVWNLIPGHPVQPGDFLIDQGAEFGDGCRRRKGPGCPEEQPDADAK